MISQFKRIYCSLWLWVIVVFPPLAICQEAVDSISQVVPSSMAKPNKPCDCECQFEQNHCPAFFMAASEDERNSIKPCRDSQSNFQSAWNIMRDCSHGASDVARKPLMSLLHMVVGPDQNQPLDCEHSLLGKYSILKPLEFAYKKDMREIMYEKWTCSAIAIEINNKIGILNKSIESKRVEIREKLSVVRNLEIPDGDKEFETIVTAKLSPVEKQFLALAPGPKVSNCYTPEAKARYWCEGIINAYITVYGGAAGAVKGIGTKQIVGAETRAIKIRESVPIVKESGGRDSGVRDSGRDGRAIFKNNLNFLMNGKTVSFEMGDSKQMVLGAIDQKMPRIVLVGEIHFQNGAKLMNYPSVLEAVATRNPSAKKWLFLEYPMGELERVVNQFMDHSIEYSEVEQRFGIYNLIPPMEKTLTKAAQLGFRAKCVDQFERTGDVNSFMAKQISQVITKDSSVGVYIVGQNHLTTSNLTSPDIS